LRREIAELRERLTAVEVEYLAFRKVHNATLKAAISFIIDNCPPEKP